MNIDSPEFKAFIRTEPSTELYERAIAILRERGLSKKKFIAPDGSGRVCMLGALALAAGSDDPDDGAYLNKITRHLAEVISTSPADHTFAFSTVTWVNDKQEDVGGVIAILQTAAEEVT